MNKILYAFWILLGLICLTKANAQEKTNVKDSLQAALIVSFTPGYSFVAGDMAQRFGNHASIGTGVTYKFRNNILLGASVSYLFGDSVREDSVLDGLRTSLGSITAGTGHPALVFLALAGFKLQGNIGYILPVFNHNPNSGLMLKFGAGLLQHKIKITVEDNNVVQLGRNYKKGYDRLSNGLAISETIGFFHLASNRRVNFSAGLELTQAWTKNRRSWNFDTMEKDNTLRHDYFYSIKLSWLLPIYIKKAENIMYY
ncbi:MAG: autotransporter outer membrane beta-barrel domain-containing protein [Bacteroidetes bacterium]|nr:autotransporter outer membrane beta-barrel domain-containing protein [Bacteroidota bacterium]